MCFVGFSFQNVVYIAQYWSKFKENDVYGVVLAFLCKLLEQMNQTCTKFSHFCTENLCLRSLSAITNQ